MIKLDTFAGGVLKEKFAAELEKVLENIADPNTKDTNIRKINLSISFKPSEDRDIAEVSIDAKSILAGTTPKKTKILIDKDIVTGKVHAAEFGNQIPGQVELNTQQDQPAGDNNIVDLRSAK